MGNASRAVQAISSAAGLLAGLTHQAAIMAQAISRLQAARPHNKLADLVSLVVTLESGLSGSSNIPGKRSAAVGGVSGGTQDVGRRQCKHTAMYANRFTWSTRACIRLQPP